MPARKNAQGSSLQIIPKKEKKRRWFCTFFLIHLKSGAAIQREGGLLLSMRHHTLTYSTWLSLPHSSPSLRSSTSPASFYKPPLMLSLLICRFHDCFHGLFRASEVTLGGIFYNSWVAAVAGAQVVLE